MKNIFVLVLVSVAFSACANLPGTHSTARTAEPTPADRTETSTAKTVKDRCANAQPTLKADKCLLPAWQHYLIHSLQLDETQRQQQLGQLQHSNTDTLKRLLLLTHPDEPLPVRIEHNRLLEQAINQYDPALQSFLTLVVAYNQTLMTQDTRADASLATLNALLAELNVTKQALDEAQQKIDAITNIEQQLNAEESLSHDNDR